MTMEKYYQLKAEGRCYVCGKPLDNPTYAKCLACLKLKQPHPYVKEVDKVRTENNTALDAMAIEAHDRGISYGKLQSEETNERIRAAEKANLTLKRWGRSVMFG